MEKNRTLLAILSYNNLFGLLSLTIQIRNEVLSVITLNIGTDGPEQTV